MHTILASIDLGSHTARLLIVRQAVDSGNISPLFRKREYVRLAEDFGSLGDRWLTPDCMDRAVDVMNGFARIIQHFGAEQTFAVATGVVRDSKNADQLLERILRHTGIVVHVIPGEKEAVLSGFGAIRALKIPEVSYLVFDLGGGSTEFIRRTGNGMDAKSLPLGSVGISIKHAKTDPLVPTGIEAINSETDRFLQQSGLAAIGHERLIGTGGTVVTLAAIIHKIPRDQIVPEAINGLSLELEDIERTFHEMNAIPMRERMKKYHLEPERAGVILSGSLIVIRIMRHLMSTTVLVSMSDLLEGILFDFLEGEPHV